MGEMLLRFNVPQWPDHSFDGLNFNLPPGYVSIVGPNGSGKSKFMNEFYCMCRQTKTPVLTFTATDHFKSGGWKSALSHLSVSMLGLYPSVSYAVEYDEPLVLLFDHMDVGASPDTIKHVRDTFDAILEHAESDSMQYGHHNRSIYIVNATTSYEFASIGPCIDVKTGSQHTFKSYDEYREYMLSYDRKSAECRGDNDQ